MRSDVRRAVAGSFSSTPSRTGGVGAPLLGGRARLYGLRCPSYCKAALRPSCQTGDRDVVDVGAGKAVRAGVVLEGGDHPVLGLDRREPGQARVLHELKYGVVR